ncbi:MAG TPA: hypothetical protein DEO71_07110 [Chryseobacterium sp.]|nr:hypothetical protein [Chryseobacterium sp.]
MRQIFSEKEKSSIADIKSILPYKGINHGLHGFTQMIILILMKSMDIMMFKKVHADYRDDADFYFVNLLYPYHLRELRMIGKDKK